jgi:hypothetical protein
MAKKMSKNVIKNDDGRYRMDFSDLEPIEIGFNYKGVEYVLCEAEESVVCAYRNELARCTRMGPNGKPTIIGNYADTESFLVSQCVFQVGEDSHKDPKKPVTQKTIKSWPGRMVRDLYNQVRTISGLNPEQTPDEVTQIILDESEDLPEDSLRVLIAKLRELLVSRSKKDEPEEVTAGGN